MSGKKITRDEEIKLVEHVACNKCLYDRSHKDDKDTEIKENIWKEITNNMEEKSGKFIHE
jgi:heterodisulfide reductase subunit B